VGRGKSFKTKRERKKRFKKLFSLHFDLEDSRGKELGKGAPPEKQIHSDWEKQNKQQHRLIRKREF